MLGLLRWYGRFESVKGGFTHAPGWARLLLLAAALPGIVLIGLSIVALLVSILALLLLTSPVYRILRWIGVLGKRNEIEIDIDESPVTPEGVSPVIINVDDVAAAPVPPRRQIEVKIVE